MFRADWPALCLLVTLVSAVSASAQTDEVLSQGLAETEDVSTPPKRPDDAVLARQFQQGVDAYDAKRFARAFELWLPLAQNGDLAAQRNVAHLLRRGLGVEQDLIRARKFYEQSAEFGFVTAQTNLGVMLLNGEGGDKDAEEAAIWFDRAARGGHPLAQFHLARLYETGTGVDPDPGRALGWHALAARAGYQPSLDRLAELVMQLPGPSTVAGAADEDVTDQSDQIGGPQISDLSVETLPPEDETAMSEADTGPAPPTEPSQDPSLPSADVILGTPASDPADAEAANTRDTDTTNDDSAEIELAIAAYSGRRFQEAQQLFEALAYRGDAKAQYHLGRMRNRGEADPRDPVAALAWWTVAAEGGAQTGRTSRPVSLF